MEKDQEIRRAGKGSYTFRQPDTCPPDAECLFDRAGVCRCGLRRGPYEETTKMLELLAEIRAGIPLEREQLGIAELEVVAEIRAKEEATKVAAMMAGGMLRG